MYLLLKYIVKSLNIQSNTLWVIKKKNVYKYLFIKYVIAMTLFTALFVEYP